MKLKILIILGTSWFALSCQQQHQATKVTMDNIAENYVKLSLQIGAFDKGYIDAYYGPKKWLPDSSTKKEPIPFQKFKWKLTDLLQKIDLIDPKSCNLEQKLRRNFLEKQIMAASTRLELLLGQQQTFDNEALHLYDIEPPKTPLSDFDPLIDSLNILVPGTGELGMRYLEYSKRFIITKDKLDTVFNTAIAEAKKRTAQYVNLPKTESFELSYVTNKPWSGYNWYQGKYKSLIQINTDYPIYIERAIDLACHEGYPGHHVLNTMLEKELVVKNKQIEMSVYPLFSPQSFIAEGSANYGIEMAFPTNERLEYEKQILFPLAGIDSTLADKYYAIQALRKKLNFAEITIARDFLNGKITSEEASGLIQKYLLFAPDRANQRVAFYNTYRSYVINYSFGEQKMKEFVEEFGDQPSERWKGFIQLITTPRTASVL